MSVTSPSFAREGEGARGQAGTGRVARALVPVTVPVPGIPSGRRPAQPRATVDPFTAYILSRIVSRADEDNANFKTKSGIAAYNAAHARAAKPAGHRLGTGIVV